MEGNGNTTFSVPMAPAGYGGGMFGDGMNGIWGVIILLAVLGYGNGGILGGGGRGYGYGGEIQRGFDQNAVMNGINAIQASQDTNQMALMQQFFNMLTQFQNCCCENRLGVAQLGTAIAQEAAATRLAAANGDQMIMNKLCQLELDGIKRDYENRIAGMQNQIDALRTANQDAKNLSYFNSLGDRFQASQDVQTAALEQYLAPVPRPAYIVQNPNCCGFGYGGCGGYTAA